MTHRAFALTSSVAACITFGLGSACSGPEPLFGTAERSAALSLEEVPAELEARVLWLVPTEEARDGVLDENEDDTLWQGLRAASMSVGSLPSDFSGVLEVPEEAILTHAEGGGSWVYGLVAVAAPDTLDALEAGQPIAGDAVLGVSKRAILFIRDMPIYQYATGMHDGFQLIEESTDPAVIACNERYNACLDTGSNTCSADCVSSAIVLRPMSDGTPVEVGLARDLVTFPTVQELIQVLP